MPLPTLSPAHPILLKYEPLTPESFSPFGTAICPSLRQTLTHVPSTPPSPQHPTHQPPPIHANQRTALKTSPISPLTNNYPPTSASPLTSGAGLASIFSCFPRRNTYLDPATGKLRLRLEILERHPFTSQTFCPMNFSLSSSVSKAGERPRTWFLVVVAPTVHDPSATPPNPPDLARVRAFVVPTLVDGGVGMAVTYAAGTWHAPMVVLGDRRVDFLVTQFANGVAGDDCQEVRVGDASKGIEVDLAGLGVGLGSEVDGGLWRAKL